MPGRGAGDRGIDAELRVRNPFPRQGHRAETILHTMQTMWSYGGNLRTRTDVAARNPTATFRSGIEPQEFATMMIPSDRTTARRVARMILAGAAVLLAQQGAAASDDGVHQFFSAIFGGGAAEIAVAPAPVQNQGAPGIPYRAPRRAFRGRPLTVQLHKAKPKLAIAQLPTKPGKVSIFDDRTLRRGDAVMTAGGIRIFAGSGALPHASSDFVDLKISKELGKDITKVLAEVDRLPRG